MVHQFFSFSKTRARMQEGPLGHYVEDFAVLLHEQGYSRKFAGCQIRWVADFSRWVSKQGLSATDLNQQSIVRYLRYRKRRVRLRGGIQAALNRFLNLLNEKGISRQEPCTILRSARQIEEELFQGICSTSVDFLPNRWRTIFALSGSFSRNVSAKETFYSPTCELNTLLDMYNVVPPPSAQDGSNFLQQRYVPS